MARCRPSRSAFAALAILAGLIAVTVTAAPAAADCFPPSEPLVYETTEGLLTEGRELERSGRWTQALTHYAEALRDSPRRRDLEERLEIARLHCDLTRRYADNSFTELVSGTTEQQSLDLYGEVLAKIDKHYVIRDTASASEIFAGAVRDHHRGEVVGERSFGKGTTQGIFELGRSEAGLRLTMASFKTPGGRSITANGVAPTILVHATARPANDRRSAPDGHEHRDAVLAAGIEAAQRLAATRLPQR